MTTFWVGALNPGVRYVRSEMPARALGARLLSLDEEKAIDGQDGVGVWQLVANWMRYWAMKDSQQVIAPALVEIDDDYTQWDDRYSRQGSWQQGLPPLNSPFVASVGVHRRAVELADGVVVSTPHLASVYRELNDRVFVCRNAVEPADWPEVLPRDDGVFRIVFAGSIDAGDLALVGRGLEWAARQPGVEVYVFGTRRPLRGVRSIGWTEDLAGFRRRLVELRPDLGLRPVENTRFSRSKSDLKVLEYAMAGAASLVSSHEAYLGWRDSPVRFAHDARSWEQEIRRAVRDRDRVREDAAVLRARVLAERTMEQTAPEWRAAVDAV